MPPFEGAIVSVAPLLSLCPRGRLRTFKILLRGSLGERGEQIYLLVDIRWVLLDCLPLRDKTPTSAACTANIASAQFVNEIPDRYTGHPFVFTVVV